MAVDSILLAAKDGGFAKPSLYRVIPGGDDSGLGNIDQFLIKSASLPAATLGTIDLPYRGRKVKIPSSRTYEPWNITVTYAVGVGVVDIRASFQNWINTIQSPLANEDNSSAWGESWEVSLLDPADPSKTISGSSFTLWGCYPSELGTVSLSTESADTLAEFSVTIYYSYHTVGTIVG